MIFLHEVTRCGVYIYISISVDIASSGTLRSGTLACSKDESLSPRRMLRLWVSLAGPAPSSHPDPGVHVWPDGKRCGSVDVHLSHGHMEAQLCVPDPPGRGGLHRAVLPPFPGRLLQTREGLAPRRRPLPRAALSAGGQPRGRHLLPHGRGRRPLHEDRLPEELRQPDGPGLRSLGLPRPLASDFSRHGVSVVWRALFWEQQPHPVREFQHLHGLQSPQHLAQRLLHHPVLSPLFDRCFLHSQNNVAVEKQDFGQAGQNQTGCSICAGCCFNLYHLLLPEHHISHRCLDPENMVRRMQILRGSQPGVLHICVLHLLQQRPQPCCVLFLEPRFQRSL